MASVFKYLDLVTRVEGRDFRQELIQILVVVLQIPAVAAELNLT